MQKRETPWLGDTPIERLVSENDSIRLAQLADPSAPHSANIASGGYALAEQPEPLSAKVDVVGAGMAGLLAAAMLRGRCAGVYEAAPELPNNHSAVLRFRSSVVADTLGIPFRAVQAMKAIAPWRNPIADALAYSLKTNGTAALRSVASADGSISQRFVAPEDLIERMAALVHAPMHFGESYPFWARKGSFPIVSTIPMPSLMAALQYPRRDRIEFSSRPGINVSATLAGCDAYCSLYVPDPAFPAARISLMGNRLVAECYVEKLPFSAELVAAEAAELLGLSREAVSSVEARQQKYAKILPIDEGERRRFIMWASDEHGIYSLGRFATWRPGLLLDDVVQDVRVIQRLISNRAESYAHKLKG